MIRPDSGIHNNMLLVIIQVHRARGVHGSLGLINKWAGLKLSERKFEARISLNIFYLS